MKMKTSELSGAALDRAVLKALNDPVQELIWATRRHISYSSDWSFGGPIIEREGIGLNYYPDSGLWHAGTCEGTVWGMDRTPLIAAMRCYVISRLGDVVEIPEEVK